MNPGILVLEDGRYFKGRRFGADKNAAGEVVFNTSMVGYQEILTDPSYAGQIVTMTYPMIGNYGISKQDFEARKSFIGGFICREVSRIPSNWRSSISLPEYLERQGVPGLCGIDTRALVRHLRDRGAMRGMIFPDENQRIEDLVQCVTSVREMAGRDLASVVSAGHIYHWAEADLDLSEKQGVPSPDEKPQLHVVVYDFGVKRGILRQLAGMGCRVTVVPAQTTAAEVLQLKPNGVLLSNGPGDPKPVSYAVENVRELLGKVPLFGICLGHQILALSVGADAYKLKFGHRGANHPVQDLSTMKVQITSQNHGFCIDPATLDESVVKMTHINLNDQTCAGIEVIGKSAFSVQYHPEASPGPRDANYLFRRFLDLMQAWSSRHKALAS